MQLTNTEYSFYKIKSIRILRLRIAETYEEFKKQVIILRLDYFTIGTIFTILLRLFHYRYYIYYSATFLPFYDEVSINKDLNILFTDSFPCLCSSFCLCSTSS